MDKRRTAPAALTLLIDTNVWLDFYLASRRYHEAACALFTRAVSIDAQLLYAAPSIRDVHYLLGLSLKRMHREAQGSLDEDAASAINEIAWKCTLNMAELACAVGVDDSDIWLARKHRALHDDFEDDLIIAAAISSDASYLVTNDEQFLKASPVRTLSVEKMLTLL